MSYIETAANNFGKAINDSVIDCLFNTLEAEISLTDLINKANEEAIEENEKTIAKMKSKAPDEETAKEYDDLKPSLINTKDKIACLNFGFSALLKQNKTVLHDVDEGGNLVIKIFKLDKSFKRKIKTSYKVTYE